MTERDQASPPPFATIPTHIPGLDAVLQGGLLRSGVYMVEGLPGAGKTILANQLCFAHAARGGRAVYLTLLAESHARMLNHLRSLTFYNGDAIGDALYYLSAFQTLEEGGLGGLLEVIRSAVRDRHATLLILDGLATARELNDSALSLRRFIQHLQLFLETLGCTALLLTRPAPDRGDAEHTMVDGVIELRSERRHDAVRRLLTVTKLRGKGILEGDHSYAITGEGIAVYPRIDALYATSAPAPPADAAPMRFDIPTLDAMLGWGIRPGTTTLLLGASGTGKTLLGLSFLAAGVRAGQQGLYFGFSETSARLVALADRLGLGLGHAVEEDALDLLWQPLFAQILDALAGRLLDAVARRGVRRLCIDGLDGFRQAAPTPGRFNHFLAALTNELRVRGVTTVMSRETPEFLGRAATLPIDTGAALFENVIFLHGVESQAQAQRLLTIMKMREGGYDGTTREFAITAGGIVVAAPAARAAAIRGGGAQTTDASEATEATDG